jgi:hypothetical protein
MSNFINTIIAACVNLLANAPSIPGSREIELFPVIEVGAFAISIAAAAIVVMILAEARVPRSK